MTDEQTSVLDLGTNIKPPKATKKTAAQGLPKTRRIILEESDTIPPTGLFVGLNGKGYLIRPGEPVDLPEPVLEILRNAVASTPLRGPEGEILGYRDRTVYPYRFADET